jgi:cysteine desulfurase / selenocysteine lyase
MDGQKIKSDFPILEDVIYLDSASTSLTPEPVLDAVLDYYHNYRANIGRGIYRTAQIADQRYRDAHRKVADFIDARVGATIFTRNTTESINMVAMGIGWKKGDKVVTTIMEHHSNLLPWMRLNKVGVELETIVANREGIIDLAEWEKAIDDRTRLVSVSQLSNALGTVQPVKEISEICQEHGAMLLVDGAQSVPHMPISVSEIGCDFLCFSGHKMLGPTGTGVLWIKRSEEIAPLLAGGGMVEDADGRHFDIKKGYEGFEAGTPDISGGIGLGAAVDYLKDVGVEEIHRHESKLTRRLLQGLQAIDGVDIIGPQDPIGRGAVVSFNVSSLMPQEVALMLDSASNISVRSGHHCCIPLMKHLGLKYGTVRASMYLYNTKEEIDKLLSTVDQISRMG